MITKVIMITKEQLIKEAWGNSNKTKVEFNKDTGYSLDFLEVDSFVDEYFDMIFCHSNNGILYAKIRPKQLQGIEDNNGWISIKSEEDLPQEFQEYHVIRDNFFHTARYVDKNRWVYSGNDYPKTTEILNITHYQPIIKPKMPLHK
jgi:hypothetical protein